MSRVPGRALEPLLACVRRADAQVRRNAVLAIAALDPLPRSGADALLRACKDKDALTRTIATDAVKRLLADPQRSWGNPG
jgi:vesicle coat complex subunit